MRNGNIERKTSETTVVVKMNLDGSGKNKINTGIGFFDHMLQLFSYHSGIDLEVECKGDLHVDGHHTVEDIGIAMGTVFNKALGGKNGIARYGFFILPMDETLCTAVIDISGRAYYAQNVKLFGMCGEFDAELCEEFFRAFSGNALVTLHLQLNRSGNLHHEIECMFKAFAHAVKAAITVDGDKIPSTKGVL